MRDIVFKDIFQRYYKVFIFVNLLFIALGKVMGMYGTSIFCHFHVQLFVYIILYFVYFYVLHLRKST